MEAHGSVYCVKAEPAPSSAAAAGMNCGRGVLSDLGAMGSLFTLLRERPLLPVFSVSFIV